MTRQVVSWIALPRGIDVAAHTLRLSVFISPRLSGDTGAPDEMLSLSQFADFAVWPERLNADPVSFVVELAGQRIQSTIVSAPPDPSLWASLFGASTPVQSYVSPDDPTGRPVLTYSHAALRSHVRDSFIQTHASSPINVPDRQTFARTAFAELHASLGSTTGGSLSDRIERGLANARALATVSGASMTQPFVDTGTQASQFDQLIAFHHRSKDAAAMLPAPVPPTLDFHQILTSLADYPELLRRLGLVIDLEFAEGTFPATGAVRVVPRFNTPLGGVNYSPFTAYILEGEHAFLAASRAPAGGSPPEFVAGMVNLARPEYQAVEIDIDDAALKSVAAVSANARLLQTGAGNQESSGGLPTLRSSGLGIVRAGHADILHTRFTDGLRNNSQLDADLAGDPGTATVTLFAEDLTRGWRVDVLDAQTGSWRSLHRRVGVFEFTGQPGDPLSLTLAEEGMLQPAPTQVVGNDGEPAGPEVYIHEGLFQWRGWSLAGHRPGKAITQANGPQDIINQVQPGGVPLAVNFEAEPGTLPRLRFGRGYQFRMRAVDLGGASLALAEADDALATLRRLGQPLPVLPDASTPMVYKRFEPVTAPLCVPRSTFAEGASVAVLVIRSNRGLTAEQYAAQLNQLVGGSYSGVDERHLVPPKTSQFMAERLGLFDAASADQTYPVATREKGSLIDGFVYDANGAAVLLPPGTIQTVTTSDDTATVDGPPSAKNPPRGYVVHTEAQLQPTFLPDPLSRGASLFDLPGAPTNTVATLDVNGQLVIRPRTIEGRSSLTQIDFGQPDVWPNMRPFRLHLRDDPSVTPPAWDSQQRVLGVSLPPAGDATAKLSSFLGPDDVDVLGIWQWLLEAGVVSPTTDSLDLAVAGALWLLTPPREIRFVHAVQQPLFDPELHLASVAPREVGATFTYFGGTARIHGPSTAKLDVVATWTDRLDGPNLSSPVSAHVFEVPIRLPDEAAETPPPSPDLVPIATYDAASEVVTFQTPPMGDESGRKFLARHEFGDTKHRQVTYRVLATSRFREYFPPQVTDFTAVSQASVNVPSSARPAAPGVLYALPVFEWTRTTGPDGSQARVRQASGIRVYLSRPWFVSGDGEQLAVVLADPSNYPPDQASAPYVTQWGMDPIWDATDLQTGNVTRAPEPNDFGGVPATGLALSEQPGTAPRVSIAAHDVEFDADRQVWYCDIPVDPGQVYCPFVRLALARYQPSSIAGLELSRVVLADYVQLLPQRTVGVQPVPRDPNSFTLAVTGLTYAGSAWSPGPLDLDPDAFILNPPPEMTPPDLIQVTVEQRIAGAPDEAGWQPAGTGTAVRPLVAAKSDRPGGGVLWNGTVALPAARTPGQFRVVIREYEQLFTDQRQVATVNVRFPGTDEGPPGHPHLPPHVERTQVTFAPGGPSAPIPEPGRMVFAETIEF